jgi:hypothetical protein
MSMYERRENMTCPHDLAERETMVADGTCPICLMEEIDRLRREREEWRNRCSRWGNENGALRGELAELRAALREGT